MKKLKILALNWRDPLHPEAGGAEVHLDHLLSFLAKKHEVVLISTRVTKTIEVFSYHGYEVRREGHPFLFNFTFSQLWKKCLFSQGFDLIIDDVSKIGLQTPLYIKDVPIIAIFHHIHGHTLFQLLPLPVACYVYFMERIALRSYLKTPMLVVSESTKQELLNFANFQKIILLPNGIDRNYIEVRRLTKIPFQLCTVGRLTRAKRVDLSLKTFQLVLQQYPQARLLIAGRGSQEQTLKKYAKQLHIDHAIEFLGYISEEEKKRLLEQSQALLFTSEKEGWGITAIEASACSCPVFGFEVQGVRDAVRSGVNGFLTKFSDAEALAALIIRYLQDSKNHILQERALCYAKNFDWDKIAQEFELILFELIQESK
ncbi:MAG: glycosyltransferase family 4 protein [Brevinema sp.]